MKAFALTSADQPASLVNLPPLADAADAFAAFMAGTRGKLVVTVE